jgi:potassium/hydrogen antiporter
MAVSDQLILFGGALLLLSILASVVSSRVGAPLLLVFLVIGMLLGEDGPGGIHFDDFDNAYLIASLALAIILFDGGFRTPFAAIRTAWGPAAVLATVGVLVTAAVTGLAAAIFFTDGWLEALLVGAVVASTDAAAVFLLLHQRGMELHRRVSTTLEVESGANDPMAVFLTITLVEAITIGGAGQIASAITQSLLLQLGLGAVIGLAGGAVLTWMVNRLELAAGLYPVFVVAAALVIFGGAQTLGGSGFLAVYLAGILSGNRRLRASKLVRRFHDGIAWVSQIVMFLMLGLLVTPTNLLPDLMEAGVVALFLMFVARPLAVAVCLAPFRFTPKERVFISWVGLRGAVPIFLAIIPVLGGVPDGLRYFNVAFLVVLASLLLQGWTVPWLARRLDVEVPPHPEPSGKLDIDLPSHLDRDVIGYHVARDSLVAGRRIETVALPGRTRIIAVLRQNRVVPLNQLQELESGDFVLMVAPPEHVFAVDRLFMVRSRIERAFAGLSLGDFSFPADVPLGQVAREYDLPAAAGERKMLLGAFVGTKVGTDAAVGDSCRIGNSELIIEAMDGDRVARVTLRLEAAELSLLPSDWRERMRRLPGAWRDHLAGLPGRLRQRLASSMLAVGDRLKAASLALTTSWRKKAGGGKAERKPER